MRALAKSDPESIGPFKLVARLGAGGMGVVYLATRGSQSVALKVLNSASIESEVAKSRFRQEVGSLSQVKSEFVAAVVDADLEGEVNWLAVEFVNGPDLRALIEDRGPLSKNEWFTLAQGTLSGLQSIHSQGLIHRDIKPANILISDSGPKIIDFGIAQDLDATSLTMTGSVAGSPAWLSPEQIDGAKLTTASDLFSLGSVLHFAATGMSPWGDQSTSTTSVVFNNILTKDPDTSLVPKPQRELVDALLQKDPTLRLSAKKALSLLSSLIDEQTPVQIDNKIRTSSGFPKKRGKSVGTKNSRSNFFRGIVAAASIAIIVTGLVTIPGLLTGPKFVCAETSYTQGDLTKSSFESLQNTEFLNVLSRECLPIESGSKVFKVEYCTIRGGSNETTDHSNSLSSLSQSTKHSYSIVKSDGIFEKNVIFSQPAGSRYGCRSFVQLGSLSEPKSRATSLGFTFSPQTPFEKDWSNLNSGDTEFSLMSDGQSGTFVTRFYATSEQDLQVSLSAPAFKQLSIELKFKSGYLPEWHKTKQDHINADWTISGLSVSYSGCYFTRYLDQLNSSGQEISISLKSGAKWKPIAGQKVEKSGCGSDSKLVRVTLDQDRVLSLTKIGSCNQIRLYRPPTGSYRTDTTVYCLTVKES